MSSQRDNVYDSKAANWTNAEIEKLVEIWAEPQLQLEMDSTYRNFFVFEKISSRLAEHGMNRPASQCRVKIKNLKSTYTKLRDSAPYELEKLKIRSPAFVVVENVLTNKLMDGSLEDNQADDSLDQSNYMIKIENNTDQADQDEDAEDEDYEPEEMVQESQDQPSFSTRSANKANKKLSLNLLKRKRPTQLYDSDLSDQILSYENGLSASKKITLEAVVKRLDKLEKTFQEGILCLQKQLRDERKFYMECEERRLKFFAELEEKRRRDEREHELKLFRLFSDVRGRSNENSAQGSGANNGVTLNDITVSRNHDD